MRRAWVGMVVLVALAASACAGRGGQTVQPAGGGQAEGVGEISIGGKQANDHGTAEVAGQTALAFELDDLYFEPTVLSGESGQSLTLRASNEGNVAHTFTAEALDVDVTLDPGASQEIEVTFPDSGAVLFLCRFHDRQGMRGALSVGGDLTIRGSAGGGERTGGGYGADY